MTHKELLEQIAVDPSVCGGKPCVRGTRIPIAVILDGLSEGLRDHYPQLTSEHIRGALACAAELASENVWKVDDKVFVNSTRGDL